MASHLGLRGLWSAYEASISRFVGKGFVTKRHATRPRNVDFNKKFTLQRATDSINDGPISVPKISNTIIPVVEEVRDPVKLPHSYHPTGHFVRMKWLGEDVSSAEYELQEEDLPLLLELKKFGVVDASLIEWLITVWERDIEKGQEIPLELAWCLVADKDKLLTVTHPRELVEQVYEHWLQRRKTLKHALIRRYWKSDLCEDKNLKLVFRPYLQERMKTRNSRKNDKDSLHQMRQLKNNLDELYDLLVTVQVRESLKKYHLDVDTVLFEQQVEELKRPDFVHPRLASLTSSDIIGQSVMRRKSSKQYEEPHLKKPRIIIPEQVRVIKPKSDKPPTPVLKKAKVEIGPELAMIVCSIVGAMSFSVDTLPLKRTLSMREEEQEDTAESLSTNETEEPQILARRRYIRGHKAAAIERYFPGTFRNEANENFNPSFSEDEEIDDRFCKALGTSFKVFLRERKVGSH